MVRSRRTHWPKNDQSPTITTFREQVQFFVHLFCEINVIILSCWRLIDSLWALQCSLSTNFRVKAELKQKVLYHANQLWRCSRLLNACNGQQCSIGLTCKWYSGTGRAIRFLKIGLFCPSLINIRTEIDQSSAVDQPSLISVQFCQFPVKVDTILVKFLISHTDFFWQSIQMVN